MDAENLLRRVLGCGVAEVNLTELKGSQVQQMMLNDVNAVEEHAVVRATLNASQRAFLDNSLHTIAGLPGKGESRLTI